MKVMELISGMAAVAFMISVCTIESLSLFSIITMIVSGALIVGCGFVMEEEKRMRGGR